MRVANDNRDKINTGDVMDVKKDMVPLDIRDIMTDQAVENVAAALRDKCTPQGWGAMILADAAAQVCGSRIYGPRSACGNRRGGRVD